MGKIPEYFIAKVEKHLFDLFVDIPMVLPEDEPLLEAAITYGIGPYDTACQLVDNRLDAALKPYNASIYPMRTK